jgi:hypothetical protein
MVVITDLSQIAVITDTHLQQLIEQRIQEISECSPWDAEEIGPIVVAELGDTAADLETVMGFSILEGIIDSSRFGDEDFAPSFEFAEAVSRDLFELVYIVSDSGYGYDIFVMNRPGIDPTLLAFCETYAVPAP